MRNRHKEKVPHSSIYPPFYSSLFPHTHINRFELLNQTLYIQKYQIQTNSRNVSSTSNIFFLLFFLLFLCLPLFLFLFRFLFRFLFLFYYFVPKGVWIYYIVMTVIFKKNKTKKKKTQLNSREFRCVCSLVPFIFQNSPYTMVYHQIARYFKVGIFGSSWEFGLIMIEKYLFIKQRVSLECDGYFVVEKHCSSR